MWYKMKIHLRVLPTCVNPLPAHSEGSPGLDEVIGDGAAVVSAGAPDQLSCTVCHLLHCQRVWWAGGTWLNHRNRHCVRHLHMQRHRRGYKMCMQVCRLTHTAGKDMNSKYICTKKTHPATLYCHKRLLCLVESLYILKSMLIRENHF